MGLIVQGTARSAIRAREQRRFAPAPEERADGLGDEPGGRVADALHEIERREENVGARYACGSRWSYVRVACELRPASFGILPGPEISSTAPYTEFQSGCPDLSAAIARLIRRPP